MNTDNESLPSQYELTKISAILKNDQTEQRSGYEKTIVEQAFDLWKDSGDLLKIKEQQLTDTEQRRIEYVGEYRRGLMVGKHYLPPLPNEFFKAEVVTMPNFLRQVVGLSDSGMRMKWFRAYVKSQQQEFCDSKATAEDFAVLGKILNHAKLTDAEIDGKDLEEDHSEFLMEFFRENNFTSNEDPTQKGSLIVNNTTYIHAKLFREWRLKMKTDTKQLTKHNRLKDCLKKGLDELKKKND